MATTHCNKRRISPPSRTSLRIESLERRELFVSDFCNSFNVLDINDDGFVIPQDVLLVVTDLNKNGIRRLADSPPTPGRFLDANCDEFVSPLDALRIVNHLNSADNVEVALTFGLTPDSDPNGNGVVLQSAVTLRGQTTAGTRVRLTDEHANSQIASVDASGHFQFSLEIPTGDSHFRIAAVDPRGRNTVIEQTIRYGDVVLDWNASLLNVIRDWTTLSNDPYPNRIVTAQPPMVARNLAIVHAAMFDAINGIEQTHESLHANLLGPEGASSVAAAAAAAYRVASKLYKEADEIAVFDASLIEALATVPDGPAKTAGVDFGNLVGDSILAWRTNDGVATSVQYIPGTDPGDWQRTFPDYYPPLLPHWPNVKPFAVPDITDFRAAPPPALDSAEYAANVDEVLRLGGLNSIERTADQTEIALFWSDGGGTYTPPGHWNQIAADVALATDSSLAENARTFAMLNVAMADAGISSWDSKYAYNLWRPVDAIRKGDLDGNAATVQDTAWTPLLRTPPFPTYTSGHSTFSNAASTVLTSIFGAEVHFTSRADGHTGFTQRPLSEERITTRSFTSFEQAAAEAGLSRIYGGIHFGFDNSAGKAAGRAIGEYVVANLMNEVE